jgi:hypothetical protein
MSLSLASMRRTASAMMRWSSTSKTRTVVTALFMLVCSFCWFVMKLRLF